VDKKIFWLLKSESSVKFEPGGKHIMVMKLRRDINKSDEIEFKLYFKQAGEKIITVPVRK